MEQSGQSAHLFSFYIKRNWMCKPQFGLFPPYFSQVESELFLRTSVLRTANPLGDRAFAVAAPGTIFQIIYLRNEFGNTNFCIFRNCPLEVQTLLYRNLPFTILQHLNFLMLESLPPEAVSKPAMKYPSLLHSLTPALLKVLLTSSS